MVPGRVLTENNAVIITGASGTGKTTVANVLLDELREEIPGITVPADLAEHCIVVGPGAAPHALIFTNGERRVSVGVEGRITCAANEGATVVAVVGLGITVSSIWGVRAELECGALVRILEDWTMPPVELHAVFSPGRSPTPAARAFAEHVANSL